MWELLQDCCKSIPGDYLMKLVERMPRVCKSVIKAKGDYFDKSQISQASLLRGRVTWHGAGAGPGKTKPVVSGLTPFGRYIYITFNKPTAYRDFFSRAVRSIINNLTVKMCLAL
jgi:hypothetical protein